MRAALAVHAVAWVLLALATVPCLITAQRTVRIGFVATRSYFGHHNAGGFQTEFAYRAALDYFSTVDPSVQFETIYQESSTTVNKSAAIRCTETAQALVANDVHLVIGPSTSSCSMPGATVFAEAGIAQISDSATAEAFDNTTRFPTFFRVSPSVTDDTWALGLSRTVIATLREHNVTVSNVIHVASGVSSDIMYAAIEQLRAGETSVNYILALRDDAVRIMESAVALDMVGNGWTWLGHASRMFDAVLAAHYAVKTAPNWDTLNSTSKRAVILAALNELNNEANGLDGASRDRVYFDESHAGSPVYSVVNLLDGTFKTIGTADNGTLLVVLLFYYIRSRNSKPYDFQTELTRFARLGDISNMELVKLLKLIGIVSLGQPLMLVTKYYANGSLDAFLRRHHDTTGLKFSLASKLHLANDVADAMVYLSSRKLIHCDIACRNVLVSASGDCALADFGLSRNSNYCALLLSASPRMLFEGGDIAVRSAETSPNVSSERLAAEMRRSHSPMVRGRSTAASEGAERSGHWDSKRRSEHSRGHRFSAHVMTIDRSSSSQRIVLPSPSRSQFSGSMKGSSTPPGSPRSPRSHSDTIQASHPLRSQTPLRTAVSSGAVPMNSSVSGISDLSGPDGHFMSHTVSNVHNHVRASPLLAPTRQQVDEVSLMPTRQAPVVDKVTEEESSSPSLTNSTTRALTPTTEHSPVVERAFQQRASVLSRRASLQTPRNSVSESGDCSEQGSPVPTRVGITPLTDGCGLANGLDTFEDPFHSTPSSPHDASVLEPSPRPRRTTKPSGLGIQVSRAPAGTPTPSGPPTPGTAYTALESPASPRTFNSTFL
ncbi:uncharacterized protein MONBRDRAFT_12973 [Monosiga brevicollis MX1]|uniref:Protein kinase domain-containing protein n=1 Tax=Monosiga brevicollis TaxID=81824 RepID=A9VDW6_MONBE|nr:uncharacterized protein MONBRDRAFT_12973 [Monosiga brevicollis MX1]EDQ84275.1 predicted protein [Monosiga brevicollis MX1]|eukprot:XP_001750905.1 hypothetical protein [Monosiga brevicollis MX1]